ncbi:MAG: hypothetical protein LBR85_01015 [Oscillospiraceae bacterium]|nr:hypothetical protein [Oscillospiraceae bacterium]
MSPVRNQLVGMIDCLPEADQILLVEIVRRFIPDDVATPDDIIAHNQSVEEYRRGETVSLETLGL